MSDSSKKKRILILGAGFGGLYAALRLDRTLAQRDDIEVVLVDKTNFILFTPMLHEVAASDLNPTDIVNPIRKMLQRCIFYEARVESIDLHAKQVTIGFGLEQHQRHLEYDYLLLSLGADTRYFDDQTREHAMEMKTLGDAMFMRNRMIAFLELAAVEENVESRKRLLSYVVAGGGFAGVETIGAMNDFLCEAIKLYPNLDPRMLRLVLVHPGKVVLPEFSESLGRYTTDRLREAGIEVMLNAKVKSYDGQQAVIDPGEPIVAGTLLWAAGVTPPPVIQDLPMKKEKGRIVVNACMESEEFRGVWVVGDSAHIPNLNDNGKPFPATAQHAIRQGTVVAKNMEAAILGDGRTQKPFKYRMLGQLAAIGRRKGAASVLGFQFSGFIAWWLWRSAYLWKLPRLEKKIRVAIGWTIDLFFSRDLVQVLTIDDIRRMGSLVQRYHLLDQRATEKPPQAKSDAKHEPVEAGVV